MVKDTLSSSSIACVTGSTAFVNGSPMLIGKTGSDLGEKDAFTISGFILGMGAWVRNEVQTETYR